MTARFHSAGLSDPGRRRENNEDRYWADPERGIFFVIDGVGGQAAGEKAAETALHLLRTRLERQVGTPADRIREGITLANNEIYRLAAENEAWHGMACVLTVAVIENGEVTVGQVGDSRLYLILPGEIRKVTRDHSPVGEREDKGELDELSAMRHPRRNEVYRDVGSQPHTPEDPDFIEISTLGFPQDGALLLCSDGLTDLVTSKQILAAVEQHAGNPQQAVQTLITMANEAGGKDNVTAVIVEGPRFAAAVRRRMSSPRTAIPLEVERRNWLASPAAFLVYGLALALAAVYFLKPHWRETESGVGFGWGPVREPRVWRVTNDITNALVRARRGDTVVVAPGTYNEQVRLRQGIRLISERPREAVIRSSGIAIVAEDITGASIEGFRIQPDDNLFLQTGIQLLECAVDVVDNEITGTVTAGIELQGSGQSTIRANLVTAASRAALVIGGEGPGPRVVQNIFTASGHPAIVITGGARPLLSGNVIRASEPFFLPPHLKAEELLQTNIVAAMQSPKPGQRGRSATRTDAPARVR